MVEEKEAAPVVNPKLLNIVRTSKFRHIEGSVMHKSTHIDGIPPLCETVPGDSNAFSCTEKYMAVALKQVGGQIAVFEVTFLLRMRMLVSVFVCFLMLCVMRVRVCLSMYAWMSTCVCVCVCVCVYVCVCVCVSCCTFVCPPHMQLSKVGRLPTSTPTFQNKASVMDFVIDPFNCCRLVVGEELRAWLNSNHGSV